jgi:hypothetical protein
MYYSYVEIEYVATSFSPARTNLAVKLLKTYFGTVGGVNGVGGWVMGLMCRFVIVVGLI